MRRATVQFASAENENARADFVGTSLRTPTFRSLFTRAGPNCFRNFYNAGPPSTSSGEVPQTANEPQRCRLLQAGRGFTVRRTLQYSSLGCVQAKQFMAGNPHPRRRGGQADATAPQPFNAVLTIQRQQAHHEQLVVHSRPDSSPMVEARAASSSCTWFRKKQPVAADSLTHLARLRNSARPIGSGLALLLTSAFSTLLRNVPAASGSRLRPSGHRALTSSAPGQFNWAKFRVNSARTPFRTR